MLIAGLTVGIIIVVGIIFIVVRSVLVKLISMTLIVIALVLVFAIGSDKIKENVQPISIDGNDIMVYQEGEQIHFKVHEVRRVDVTKGQEGGILVTFIVEGFSYPISLGKISYAWGLKNELNKRFSGILYDATY